MRARVRLARGQTIADVTARLPTIESALGNYRARCGSTRPGDGKANQCELRVLDTDPHAETVPWPSPSVRSERLSQGITPAVEGARFTATCLHPGHSEETPSAAGLDPKGPSPLKAS
jgi:hypothetical protein